MSISDEDLGSPAAPVTQTTGLDDDFSSGTTVPRTRPAEAGETTEEVAGDPPSGGGESSEAVGESEEVSSESEPAGEFAEATPEQLAAESGEASAVDDLKGEGYEETSASGSESSTGEVALTEALTEAGAEIGGTENAEFLPFLAALVPTLVSAVGPKIAKGIAGRLSPKAKAALKRVAPPPKPGAPRVPPGSTGALLGQIAVLLKTLGVRTESTESLEAADEAMVNEAVAVLEVIIGTDDRVRIKNTAAIPWRRICALRITFPTGAVYRGTGFLIGPRAIATAGHCVYLHNQGGWARKVEVIPGADGSAKPYGSAVATQFRSVGGWVNGKKPQSDYGCVVLPPGSFGGKNLGQFAVGVLSPAQLVAKPAVLAGYPGDKPFAELWGMARKIKTVNAATLVYDIDTVGGQSGAPVYIKRADTRTVVGIHNYGASGGNSATRVTPSVFKQLSAWSKL